MPGETPFGRDGKWLRCGLHMHTTNSDGELAPDRLAAHYARAGYDAILQAIDKQLTHGEIIQQHRPRTRRFRSFLLRQR